MKIVTCPKCGNSVQDEFVKRRNACPYCGLPASEVLGTAEPEAKKAPTNDSSPPQKAKPEPTAAAGAETYTCPECGAAITSKQLNAKGMCPNCGCPAAAIYAAQQEVQAQERRENAAKESAAAAALPKTSDVRYKTGASNMLEVLAYIVWICGGISVIAIAILANQLRYSYYSSETTGTTMFFLAVSAAVSALFFGGLLYGASKLLIDLHATRVNLEMLNEQKEG